MSPETLELFNRRDASARWPEGILGDGVRHAFTERLILAGVISEDHAYAALLEQKVNPDHKIGQVLVRNGHASSADITTFIEGENPDRLVYETVTQSRIEHEILAERAIIINAETGSVLYASTGGNERRARDLLSEYYPEKRIELIDYRPANQAAFIDKIAKVGTNVKTGDKIRPEDLADRLVHQAIKRNASDIHITPRSHSFSVFFRILGVRQLIMEGTIETYRQMVTQIKDRGSMDMQESRRPQDGKFTIEHGGKLVDVRVATIPVEPAYESVTLRILDPDRITPDLHKLGISRVDLWAGAIKRKAGICLITGRTGSGKTTTLRASILSINRIEQKVMTVEDPVEYNISYVEQVSVNDLVDLHFATASKSFLRHNPDIVILGEVRDQETAQNAIRLAETGHLVLATLHATDIITAIMRLRDFDISVTTIRQLLRCVLVQDLIRTTCPHCKNHSFRVKGCKVCHGTGYAGQTIISECEYFPYPDSLDLIIARIEKGENNPPTWPTMIEDALAKVETGITDLQEVERVFATEVVDYLNRKSQKQLESPATAPD